jgi:hypothetical protein
VYGGLWKGVNMAERSGTVVARVYPALDPATVARPYVLLEFTIWQQVLGYNDKVGCFAMQLAVSKIRCLCAPRAPPRRLIKAPGVGITMVTERIQYGVLD